MNILKKIFKSSEVPDKITEKMLELLRLKFAYFLNILEKNNSTLKIISDLEEKAQGEFVFDDNYIRKSVEDIHNELNEMIASFQLMSNNKYPELKLAFSELKKEVENIAFEKIIIKQTDYIINFENLIKDDYLSAGAKNSNLAEIKNKLGICVPEGFAITAWAYKYFIDKNQLQDKIDKLFKAITIKNYTDLENASIIINQYFNDTIIPDGLAQEIVSNFKIVKRKSPYGLVSLRSSAIGEDTGYSFAGQYKSVLGVHEISLLKSYVDVLASKFSPKAIYYMLSHDLIESDLPMSVGCLQMVDAAVSGVLYTSDPVSGDGNTIIINSIYGLGELLVNGSVDPDSYRISKNDKSIIEKSIAKKSSKLMLNPQGGTTIQYIIDNNSSLSEEQISLLIESAIKIETHFGCPQDIEWAIDKKGKFYILQSRPLKIFNKQRTISEHPVIGNNIIAQDGVTACPGAGAGNIFIVKNQRDLLRVPDGSIVISENPFPGLAAIIDKCSALITRVGGIANHLVTIAREYRVPTLVNFVNLEIFTDGMEVTVDATNRIVYDGINNDIVTWMKPEFEYFVEEPLIEKLRALVPIIAKLTLIDNKSEEFKVSNCRSYQDIIRFIHQYSMNIMFEDSLTIKRDGMGKKLKSSIPLPIEIINLDKEISSISIKTTINKIKIKNNEIDSIPFRNFWEGVESEGWTEPPVSTDFKGIMSVVVSDLNQNKLVQLKEKSYAIISKEYMIISLRMGYHFSTIEAMCSRYTNRNYIRMFFKEGGALFERRVRRVKLIADILSDCGFISNCKGDTLETGCEYTDFNTTKKHLYNLGRITMLTKQLDVALIDDDECENYKLQILEKLGFVK